MVCALGSGRMGLLSGNLSQKVADDSGLQKSAARFLCRELSKANEVNLIDEEDMHVFDLHPMKDPLHLVHCNACKKPIKISQYASHAELCQSLTSLEDNSLKVHGSTGHKKAAGKDRRKTATVNSSQAKSRKPVKFDHVDSSISETQLNTILAEVKGVRTSSGTPTKDQSLDGSAIGPGEEVSSRTAILHPRKLSKAVSGEEQLPRLDPAEAASSLILEKSHSPKDHYQNPSIENEKNSVGQQISGPSHDCPVVNTAIPDVPAPLATKIYYSQRNNRERAAIHSMYYNSKDS